MLFAAGLIGAVFMVLLLGVRITLAKNLQDSKELPVNNSAVELGQLGTENPYVDSNVYLPLIINKPPLANPSWNQVTSGVASDLKSVSMLSSDMGFTVGKSGTILQWNGNKWASVVSPVTLDLTSVSIGSANSGWTVSGDKVLNWDGTNWSQVAGSPNLPFQGVDADANNAWMVGGYMVCSPNCDDLAGFISQWNGSSWSTYYSQHKYLYAIDMLSTTDGWAVGDIYDPSNPLPAIIRWDGVKWNNQTHPAVRGLYDISALDSNNAWAVGADTNYDCTLQRWDGISWTSYTCPAGVSFLSAVSMVSANDVWAVGGDDIIHWDGNNWTRLAYDPPYPLNDIDMISATEGWAVGDSGTILHYSP